MGICRIRCIGAAYHGGQALAGSSLKAILRLYELEGEHCCNFDLDQRRGGILRSLLTIKLARIWYASMCVKGRYVLTAPQMITANEQ
jgi:hypothetical protein